MSQGPLRLESHGTLETEKDLFMSSSLSKISKKNLKNRDHPKKKRINPNKPYLDDRNSFGVAPSTFHRLVDSL